MKQKHDTPVVGKEIMKGAALFGAAGAAYLFARSKSVKDGLSAPAKPCAWEPGRGRSVFLRGADIIDVGRGQTLKERGVLFKDGQITGIIPTRDLDKVQADWTFDLGGLTLMPGLVNAHCHCLLPCAMMFGLDLVLSLKRQALRNLEECAKAGVTTIRDANSMPSVLNEITRRVETFELLGPRIITSGPCLMARGGYPDFILFIPEPIMTKYGSPSLFVTGPDSARRAVRTAVEQGARFIKIFFDDRSFFFGRKPLNTLDDDSVKAIVDEAHRMGRRVGAHQSQLSGFRRALKLGVDDLEHIPTDGYLTDKDTSNFLKGNHHITPTSSVSLALGIAPEGHPARGEPVVEAMQRGRERLLSDIAPTVSEEAVERANLKMIGLYEDGSAGRKLAYRKLFDNELFLDAVIKGMPNIQKLYEGGASICCGNDGGIPVSFPSTLFVEMEIMERQGMSRADILRSATINGSKLLDLESELGSIDQGKLADILVLSDNPLRDVRAVTRVEGVFRSGTLLHRGYRFPGAEESETTA